MRGKLTKDSKISPEFAFLGECHMCIYGDGIVELQRKLGDEFKAMTRPDGEPLVFVADPDMNNIAFNNCISSNKRFTYRLVYLSSGEMNYIVSPEDR